MPKSTPARVGKHEPSRRVRTRAMYRSVPTNRTSLPRQSPAFGKATEREGTPVGPYVPIRSMTAGVHVSRTWRRSPCRSHNAPSQPPFPLGVSATRCVPPGETTPSTKRVAAAAQQSDARARQIFSWPVSFGTALVQNSTRRGEMTLPLTDGLLSFRVDNQYAEIRVDCRTPATLFHSDGGTSPLHPAGCACP